MSVSSIQFARGGVFLPGLRLWLDPHEAQAGPERVFVSHAHSDHTARHREVILSLPTARLMQARLGGQRQEHVLPFGETREFTGGEQAFRLTLLPAGHILGSAMASIEAGGRSLLYTGDFKLRQGFSAEPCEPRPADILIMETTYGRPEYRFPPTERVMRGVIRFCQEALDNDETPLLLGYSLGKSQELLHGLAGAGLPIMLHASVFDLTRIYEQLGQVFPPYDLFDAARARGKVLLFPPQVAGPALLRELGRTRRAILTGWAVDQNCRFRSQADAAFPLSDHADFPDLVEMVRRVAPEKVYTLHGFAADFAQSLRALGFDAQALSEDEQMTFRLAVEADPAGATRAQKERAVEPAAANPAASASDEMEASAFAEFAGTCAAIGASASKLEKVRLLAAYLRTVEPGLLSAVTVWFTGLPFAATENKVLQLGWAQLRDALCAVGGLDQNGFRQIYLQHSDLGETAFDILSPVPRTEQKLRLPDISEFFREVHAARGPSAKLPLLVRVLRRAGPLEAKFLIKIITGDLRIGLKEGLVEDAIAAAFDVAPGRVRQANLLLGHIGETADLARRNALEQATLLPFRPVKFMLASPEATAADVWRRMALGAAEPRDGAGARGEEAQAGSGSSAEAAGSAPAFAGGEDVAAVLWLEDKYDGVRCQLHRVGSRVALYSRDLKDVTATFPEVADAARLLPGDLILDGEVVAMRGEEARPFAELQRRLGRREADLFLGAEIPVVFVAFDLLWLDGRSLLDEPLAQRRAALEALTFGPAEYRLARITKARSVEDIEVAFRAARVRHNEGLMIKDPKSVYAPGRRGLAWLKLKKAYATLDCVVVGVEYGHGKRKAVLSDYTFAVRDGQTGELKTIGKAYSGLTDEEIARLTKHFLAKAVRQRGRYLEVEPDVVVEIAFDRLQASARHTSGLAMRFPRIVRIRTDKTAADIDTVESARRFVQ